jgi:tRNA (cmo5U34)-methyltransferase
MSSNVRETFDRLADRYDELKLRVIPGYRRIQETVHRHCELPAGASPRLLELGCGTAQWAEEFLARFPGARYDAIEFSSQMRKLAENRLAAHADRVRLLDLDLNERIPEGEFDLIVSFFAIHHVSDKATLIRDVYDRLVPGGRFLYADITVSEDPDREAENLASWASSMRDAGLDEERISEVLMDHRDNDLPEPEGTQLAHLGRAGFEPAEIVWSSEKFALFHGVKREPGA